MRLMLLSALLLVACVAENPDYSPELAAWYASGDPLPAPLPVAPPVVYPEPAMAPPNVEVPDMAWRPDLAGGQCVPKCGTCATNRDCCSDRDALGCYFGQCSTGAECFSRDGGDDCRANGCFPTP